MVSELEVEKLEVEVVSDVKDVEELEVVSVV